MGGSDSIRVPFWSWLVIALGGLLFLHLLATAEASGPEVGTALAVITVSCMAVARCLSWVDSFEPEPLLIRSWAFAWGLAMTSVAAIVATFIEGDSRGFTAALVEETAKAAGILLVWRAGSIDSWLDGVVYGGLIGLGFTFAEDIYYAWVAEDHTFTAIARAGSSVFAHSLFTAVSSALIAGGLLSSRKLLTLLGLLGAISLHGTWNFVATADETALWPFFYAMPPAALLAWAIWWRDSEQKALRLAAFEAVDRGELSPQEANQLSDLTLRRFARRQLPAHERSIFDQRMARTAKKLLSRSKG